ncbi:MAG: dihydrofolate reductase [Candidatus Nealsonbacteria bacterium RIFOXYB1_FULL_40_15]|uniref:Dihydrofolate reductase n=2 Tax=Candidatus Nealsoniibacteriota TaxID=1817911 RepID=A0A1G2EUF1_9BACT|nr:MAG: dihydrofolate reductase [Candidatus Nealsonbacteria bacterium RIFOXYB1_FULL_40_15]OGZ28607.1 MAG: dihydrofolate reductase [Candidatus Nealsonbacteria bacterium RIFOXYD1_FULL_39_11]OGZ28898.1 MAG: dihydrofolate reductase [Candidatus Nealsonbacteria bacterium RIFOXYC1_FULL_40_7]
MINDKKEKNKQTISIIAAIGKNNVLGVKNSLPWHLPADFKHFKEITMRKPVIMGQRTFESIGKALPDRINIILTIDKNLKLEGCITAFSIDDALQKTENAKEVMICGGASVYKQFLPMADKMYLTLVDAEIKEADVFFPKFNWDDWNEMERIENKSDEKNKYNYTFVTLERK